MLILAIFFLFPQKILLILAKTFVAKIYIYMY